MKIKLIHPPAYDNHLYCPDLETATLAAFLSKRGYPVEQDNLEAKCYFMKYFKKYSGMNLYVFSDAHKVQRYLENQSCPDIEKSVQKLLKIFDYDGYSLFGFIIRNNRQIAIALSLAKRIKELTGATVILGGFFPQTILDLFDAKYNFIDHITVGEGESAFMNVLENKKEKRIVFSDNKTDINSLPPPDFDALTLKIYKLIKTSYLPYETVRGCFNRCPFCTPPTTGKTRVKSPGKICDDLEFLKNNYKINTFHFSSSSISLSRQFILDLTKEIGRRKLNISWSSYAIPNSILTDAALVKKMKKSGCIKLKFGIESGSENIISSLKKPFSVEISAEVLKTVHHQSIYTYASFIHSYIYESREDHLKTLKYIKSNAKYINLVRPCKFTLQWGSPIYISPHEFGVKLRPLANTIDRNLEVHPFDETDGLTWEQKQKQQKKRQKEIIALANYLKIFNESLVKKNTKIPLDHELRLEQQGFIKKGR